MGGLARAIGRLLVMGGVLAAVLVTCLILGVGTTIAVALGIVVAGLVGMVGVARRAAPAAMPSAPLPAGTPQATFEARPTSTDAEAMNPATTVDPESLMPRWRRPSLLEARRADPGRDGETTHAPLRFDARRAEADLRTVGYAVVPVMDRPDEVLGTRLTVLGSGDEVEVVNSSGAFLEVICPSGERGWIHRMTISQPSPSYLAPGFAPRESEAEDVLTALLAARGIQ
jgi:hypothetical protein